MVPNVSALILVSYLRSRILISARIQTTLNEICRDFSSVPPGKFRDSTSKYVKVVFISFSIHYSFLFISVNAVRSKLLRTS